MNFIEVFNMIVELVQQFWQAFLALGGVAVFIPAFINLLKKLGVVGEGQANPLQATLQAVLFLIFVGFRIFLPDFDLTGLDAVLRQLANVIVFLLSFLGQFGITRFAYEKLWKGRAGVFGYYHS